MYKCLVVVHQFIVKMLQMDAHSEDVCKLYSACVSAIERTLRAHTLDEHGKTTYTQANRHYCLRCLIYAGAIEAVRPCTMSPPETHSNTPEISKQIVVLFEICTYIYYIWANV